jgi:hypothetical protein
MPTVDFENVFAGFGNVDERMDWKNERDTLIMKSQHVLM